MQPKPRPKAPHLCAHYGGDRRPQLQVGVFPCPYCFTNDAVGFRQIELRLPRNRTQNSPMTLKALAVFPSNNFRCRRVIFYEYMIAIATSSNVSISQGVFGYYSNTPVQLRNP